MTGSGHAGAAMSPSQPPVSIILPTLDERAYMRDCLDSLPAQDYPAVLEVLVCDGGSRDGTREIVEQYGSVRAARWTTPASPRQRA